MCADIIAPRNKLNRIDRIGVSACRVVVLSRSMATYTTLPLATTGALANADYAEVGSVDKAKAYVSALEAMLLLMPKATAKDAASVTLAPEEIRMRLKAANNWLLSNDTDGHGGGVKHLSVGGFRS